MLFLLLTWDNIGKFRVSKGSKVILIKPHSGHVIVDLNCPQNKSVIIESFLLKLQSQYLLAQSSSDSSFPFSFISIYSFLVVLFKSSFKQSKKTLINSLESCCPYPLNLTALRPIVCLKSEGSPTLVPSTQYW